MPLVGEIGKANPGGSSTTLVVTVATAPGAGNFLVLRGSGSVSVTSVTDTKGNTWTIDKAAGATPLPFLASTKQDVGTLTTSDTITVTYSSASNNRSAIIDEFSGVMASPLDQTQTAAGAGTSRTAGTTAATTQANELVVGCFVIGSAETSFTPGAGYSSFTTPFLGGLSGEYKIVAATGTQNPTATGGVSATSRGVVATYKLASGQNVTLTPATATNVAQVLSLNKVVTLTPALEADAAQPVTNNHSGVHNVTLTPATSTQTAVALTVRKVAHLVPVTEKDKAITQLSFYTYSTISNAATYDGTHFIDAYVPTRALGNAPVVVLAHGGQWDSNAKDTANIVALAQKMAQLGFVTFSVDFTQEQAGVDAQIDRQTMVDDVSNAIAWAKANAGTYGGNAARVGALGMSSGGHLIFMCATTKTGTHQPNASVGWSPPCRLATLIDVGAGVAKGYLDDAAPSPALYAQYSPYNQVTSACTPLRIVGSTDESTTGGGIGRDQYDDMYSASVAVGINVEETLYSGSTHADFTGKDTVAAAQWLSEALSSGNHSIIPTTETEVAQPPIVRKRVTLAPALSANTAQALTTKRRVTAGVATETDTARPLNYQTASSIVFQPFSTPSPTATEFAEPTPG